MSYSLLSGLVTENRSTAHNFPLLVACFKSVRCAPTRNIRRYGRAVLVIIEPFSNNVSQQIETFCANLDARLSDVDAVFDGFARNVPSSRFQSHMFSVSVKEKLKHCEVPSSILHEKVRALHDALATVRVGCCGFRDLFGVQARVRDVIFAVTVLEAVWVPLVSDLKTCVQQNLSRFDDVKNQVRKSPEAQAALQAYRSKDAEIKAKVRELGDNARAAYETACKAAEVQAQTSTELVSRPVTHHTNFLRASVMTIESHTAAICSTVQSLASSLTQKAAAEARDWASRQLAAQEETLSLAVSQAEAELEEATWQPLQEIRIARDRVSALRKGMIELEAVEGSAAVILGDAMIESSTQPIEDEIFRVNTQIIEPLEQQLEKARVAYQLRMVDVQREKEQIAQGIQTECHQRESNAGEAMRECADLIQTMVQDQRELLKQMKTDFQEMIAQTRRLVQSDVEKIEAHREAEKQQALQARTSAVEQADSWAKEALAEAEKVKHEALEPSRQALRVIQRWATQASEAAEVVLLTPLLLLSTDLNAQMEQVAQQLKDAEETADASAVCPPCLAICNIM